MKIGFGKREDYITNVFTIKDDAVVVAEVNTVKEGNKWLSNKLKEMEYKSYYLNVNFIEDNNLIEIDYGSYTNFCYFWDLTDENWNEFFGGNR